MMHRSRFRSRSAGRLAAAAFLVAAFGCKSRPASETPTRGRLVVTVAESHAPLVQREADLFNSLYPDARVTVRAVSTREAFVQLVADSVRLVVVDRPPNDEEQRALRALRVEVESVHIAEDALGIVVRSDNELENLSAAEVGAVLAGQKTDWSELPGSHQSGPIRLVLTGRNSGAWELLAGRFFPDAALPGSVAASQTEVLMQVERDRRALGIVSVAAWKDPGVARPRQASAAAAGWAPGVSSPAAPDVRALGIAATDSSGRAVVHALHQANIHLGVYPFHYPVQVLFNKESLLAAGFSAFLASAPGQKLVLSAGLVPATMPVRLVQLR